MSDMTCEKGTHALAEHIRKTIFGNHSEGVQEIVRQMDDGELIQQWQEDHARKVEALRESRSDTRLMRLARRCVEGL
jgi:hypothetical protein